MLSFIFCVLVLFVYYYLFLLLSFIMFCSVISGPVFVLILHFAYIVRITISGLHVPSARCKRYLCNIGMPVPIYYLKNGFRRGIGFPRGESNHDGLGEGEVLEPLHHCQEQDVANQRKFATCAIWKLQSLTCTSQVPLHPIVIPRNRTVE